MVFIQNEISDSKGKIVTLLCLPTVSTVASHQVCHHLPLTCIRGKGKLPATATANHDGGYWEKLIKVKLSSRSLGILGDFMQVPCFYSISFPQAAILLRLVYTYDACISISTRMFTRAISISIPRHTQAQKHTI